jgi:ribosomal subunit interface protein
MIVTITARHDEAAPGLKERAEEIVARLGRIAHRPTSAHVTFDLEGKGPQALCEIVLNAARGAVFVAKAVDVDHRTALDAAEAKLRRQLDKAEAPARKVRRKAASR